MSMNETSPRQAVPQSGRRVWHVALVALVVLFVISELSYLAIAAIAKAVIDGGATAHDGVLGALSNGFFTYGTSESGSQVFTLKSLFGLPGFNNLYFLVFGPFDMSRLIPFITSGLAAPLVALLSLSGHLWMSLCRGVAITLFSALLFAVAWVVLYTGAEASMYSGDVWSELSMHFLEMPVAFVSLLAVSFAASRGSNWYRA